MPEFGKMGYEGSVLPKGHGTHHYHFWVVAMDQTLNVAPSLTLEQAEPHVLGMNRLLGPK